MKRMILTTILSGAVILGTFAQQAQPAKSAFSERVGAVLAAAAGDADLPRFSLDFPGGTPDELATAIREKIDVLNVIVPNEYKNETLPSLKLKDVNVKQLFEALELASQKKVETIIGTSRQYITTSLGFRATGPIRPETVWYFHAERPGPSSQPKTVRYYQLAPYLAKYKIDDITTAIQAGWKMLGETDIPQLNYHQDTKLLIAVGPGNDLIIIDSVLQELGRGLRETTSLSTPPPVQSQSTPSSR